MSSKLMRGTAVLTAYMLFHFTGLPAGNKQRFSINMGMSLTKFS
ncbi:Undefined function [Listeria monocytogenes N53-1]|nr:Undefined function [Listeria monocytogenes]CCQ24232.1 Undefined function [Listeria monocytogenes N53-1]